jgi:hypothetical protein
MERRRRRSIATYTRLVAEAMAWRGSARAAIAAAKPGKASALRRRTPPQQHGTETTAQVLQAAPRQVGLGGAHIDGEGESSSEITQSPKAILHEIQRGGDSPGEEAIEETTRTDR